MASPEGADPELSSYREEDQQERSYTVLGTVLLAILLLIVVVLLWRSCGTDQASDSREGQGGVISDISGYDPVEGGVAVWMKPGEDIERIIARNGLEGSSYTDLGEGTYVISVGGRDTEEIVERLKEDEGLYDAGFLFSERDSE